MQFMNPAICGEMHQCIVDSALATQEHGAPTVSD